MPLLFYLLLIQLSCSQHDFRSGEVEVLLYDVRNESNKTDTLFFLKHSIFFLDSTLIHEARVLKVTYKNQNPVKEYKIYKYTYYDLVNNKCQDYYSFSDTAEIQCNYIIVPENSIYERFYLNNHQRNDELIPITDTLLSGEKYKLFRSLSVHQDVIAYYYLSCNTPNFPLHLAPGTDAQFKDCKVLRAEYIDKNLPNITTTIEFRLKRNNLNENEIKVFKQWNKNAKLTDKPLITVDEVYKICNPNTTTMYNVFE